MSPDRTKVEVEHTVRVANLANAMFAAQNFDRVRCSIGVAVMSTVLAGSDPLARTMLAKEMLKMATELDPDVIDARWQ